MRGSPRRFYRVLGAGIVAVGFFMSPSAAVAVGASPASDLDDEVPPRRTSTTDDAADDDDAEAPRLRPRYDAADELSAAPGRSIYRGVTIGVAGQLILVDEGGGPGEPRRWSVQGTPFVDMLAEIGARRIRFVAGAYTAPVSILDYDVLITAYFGLRAGFLAGNERVRAGAIVSAGWFAWEAMAYLFVTPWRDRFGNRHGFSTSVGIFTTRFPSVTFGYRFAPARLNHLGGRRRALRRPRGEL